MRSQKRDGKPPHEMRYLLFLLLRWIALMCTDIRCLEGGAEEFFLKPVQLSDLKRLRPHILKGKSNCKEQKQEQQQQENNNNNDSSSSSSSSSNNNSNNQSNKRKAMDGMDEGLSPERTRPRFSSDSLTVV